MKNLCLVIVSLPIFYFTNNPKKYPINLVLHNYFQIDTLENEAQYPGGEAAWTKYVSHVIESNMDELSKSKKGGTCKVRFIIDASGNVTDVEALTMKGSRLAKIAVEAVESSKRWEPARQHGRKVKAYREQPFTLSFQK